MARPRYIPTTDELEAIRSHVDRHKPSFPPPEVLLYRRGYETFADRIGVSARFLRMLLAGECGCAPHVWAAIVEEVPELQDGVDPAHERAVLTLAHHHGVRPAQIKAVISALTAE